MPPFATRNGPVWGCIADDITGATDLATNFVGRGMRTEVFFGIPHAGALQVHADLDVAVVALKSRTAPVDEAVRDSLSALSGLQRANVSRFYFKYCSTFDSTPDGNIGPVIDALLGALGERLTIVVPSFPAAGRTAYMGHLFVGQQLLSESPMRDHPLTPMLDSNLLRLLGAQSSGQVSLIPLSVVRNGAAAVRRELDWLRGTHSRVAVVIDAVDRSDLATIMTAAADLPLITGGSGLAHGLPASGADDARSVPLVRGQRAILCGSASARTQQQIAAAGSTHPLFKLDAESLRNDAAGEAARATTWARAEWVQDADAVPLIFSADSPGDIDRSIALGSVIEEVLGAISVALVADGVRQIIVAGGETAGRVLQDLGVTALRIGPEISPGVAWSTGQTGDGVPISLALKSGNFGAPDMFLTAWRLLEPESEAVR